MERIAIIGDRGIPARYSGFSNLAEEIAVRLVREHGMDVTVYCRTHYFKERPPTYKGVRLVYLPAPGGKSFESIIHSTLSILHASIRPFDLALVLDPGNAPFVLPLKLRRTPILLHTDGLGWQRRKWSALQRRYYRWSEWVSARLADWLVTDSRAMQDYYRAERRAQSTFIPYGGTVGAPASDACLAEFALESRGYDLVVARLEPENNTDLVIREHKAAGLTRPLIVVGGARYESDYSRRIFAQADDRVRCIGAVYDSAMMNGLLKHCRLYIHAHEVGGTNPSLLRAMDAGAACLPLGVVFHRECLGPENDYFEKDAGSLAAALRRLDADPARLEAMRRLAADRAAALYRWDAVAAAYGDLFRLMLASRAARSPIDPARADAVYRPERFHAADGDRAAS